MGGWRIRADMAEIDVERVYAGSPTVFSIRLFYGGEFTASPGSKYIKGKQKYVDLVDIEQFCIHDLDDMMDELGYIEHRKLLYYHFRKPFSDLDVGLYFLAGDADVLLLSNYVANHKLIEVYVEHGRSMVLQNLLSPKPSIVTIRELNAPPACSRRLFLEWNDPKTGDTSSSIPPVEPEVVVCENTIDDTPPVVEEVVHSENLIDESVPNAHSENFTEFVENDVSENEGIGGDSEDLTDSDDSDFLVDLDNILEEPEVDMQEFFLNIDKDVEWVGGNGGSRLGEEAEKEDAEIEVLNSDVLLSASSSDEGEGNSRRKSIRAIRRAQENSDARVGDPFYVFQKFGSAEALKDKIKIHAIETRREIEIIKNDKNRVRAVCKGTIPDLGGPSQSKRKDSSPEKKCPWVLYASRWKQDVDWEVKTYEKEHRCLRTRSVKACTYKFLSKQVVQQVESNPTVPTRALQDQLQRTYQIDISRMKVFRAKTAAVNQVRGDYAGQYTLLRDYILELQTRNPDTTVKIEVEDEPNPDCPNRTFKRIYVCLGSLKKGFAAGQRDYLGLDGSFMKGPYPGMVLTAVGLDGNNSTYPLAYAVVEAENFNAWIWFLSCLGDDLNLHRNSNFTFISDRQKGLLQAIGRLFPCAEHRFCLRHIHENMKLQWRGGEFKDMLWKCATVPTIQEFNRAMEEFRGLNNDCYLWLKAIPPVHWARSHFTARAHCDGLLNNLCETFNKQLVDARDQPIITCLEFIREYLMLRIVSIQKIIEKACGPLTPTATSVLERNKTDAAQCKGVFCGNGKYQVSGPWMDQCVVDMVQRTCSCRRWELTGIPCKHALVAIWDMRKNNQEVGVPESFVHPTFWLNTWKSMYSFNIEPINGRRMWVKYQCPTSLLPPKHHVPIGRPKKKRKKSAVELDSMVKGTKASRAKKSVTCSKCNNIGHNSRSCKGQVAGGGAGGGISGGAGRGASGSAGPSRKKKVGGAGKKGKKVV